MATATLRITIESAGNLPNMDSGFAGKSDPYVIVKVPEKKEQTIKTPVINNDLNPVWNFVGDIAGYNGGDPLEFEVWDSDTFPKPDQIIGKAILGASDFFPNGVAGSLPIEVKGAEPATLNMSIEVILDAQDPAAAVPEAQLQAQAQPEEQQQKTLQVTVVSAQTLKNMDGFLAGKSDPYVIVQVPGQHNMKFQTPVIQNDLNPQWNHTDLIQGFVLGDALEFQLWDKDNFPRPDQLMGTVTISADEFYSNPYGFDADLPLEGKGAQGTLTVKVQVHEGNVQLAEPDQTEPMPGTTDQQAPTQPGAGAQDTVKLRVEILSGLDLPHKEGFGQGKADLYCICTVPGSGSLLHKAKKFQTDVVKDNQSPEWNHVGEITAFTMGKDALEFEVWDKNNFPMPDKAVGKVTLSPEDFVANPEGLEGELPVTTDRGEPAGMIAIRVHVLPDAPATAPGALPEVVPAGPGELQPGVHNAVEGKPGAVAIGAPYHGGILVSENWFPPVPVGSWTGAPAFGSMVSAPTAMPMPMPSSQVAMPVPSSPMAMPMPSSPVAMPMQIQAPITMPAPVTQPMPAPFPMSMPMPTPTPATMTMPTPSSTSIAMPAPAPMQMPAPTVTSLPTSPVAWPAPASVSMPMPRPAPAAMPMTVTSAPMPAQTVKMAAPMVTMMPSYSMGAPAASYKAAPPTMASAAAPMSYSAAPGPAMTYTMAPPVIASGGAVTFTSSAAMPSSARTAGAAGATDANLFDRLDQNHDGVLSREEFQTLTR